MTSPLAWLRRDLTPEQEILRNRLVMGSVSGLASLFFTFDAVIFTAFFAYLSFNAALYVMQKIECWRPETRWLAAIVLDVTMAFAVMLREPEHMAIFYPIILWMILGNGFRYGVKWLFVAAVLSTTTFGIVVYSTGYWQDNLWLGTALALALFIIPAYCSTLINKISHAKEQAEAASKAKSYFLASVSHELRTPLNAIIGYGNHLRNSDMPRSQKEMVEASVLAGEHLLHLIEQLIEVAKSGTGSAKVKTTTFQPTELLTEIRDIMAVRVEDKGLHFHLQAEPLSDRTVEGPRDIIRNLLLNLVGNAVKFTEAGSISINSGLAVADGQDCIWFTVSDTGIGIAESAVERIFQPFQQADDSVMNRFGGTGLGLSICKQLVEAANGTISVESFLGRGSTFRIELPVRAPALNHAESAAHKSGREIIKILSFGELAPDLLATAQSEETFTLRHIRCTDVDDFETALDGLALADFNVALVAEELAIKAGAEHAIWDRFAAAEIAPVLVSASEPIDVDDVTLRAAFASILPPSPNFDELRSAVRIGCSFARHFRPLHDHDMPSAAVYTPQNILVADDNRTNRNVLAAILHSAGHRTTLVADGDEALQALESNEFDVLLLDINMPRLNGIDACAMWRQIEGGRHHLPVIGVTADATAETEERCRNAGMDLRITKPIDAKLLLATIEQLCGNIGDENQHPIIIHDPLDRVVSFPGTQVVQSDAIDGAQLEYLMSIGDESFLHGMIEGFLEDVEKTMEPLHLSVATSNVTDFRFCAHAFKSSGNNMGAKRLGALCGRLEKITEADFLQNGESYLDKISQELDIVTAALGDLKTRIGSPSSNRPGERSEGSTRNENKLDAAYGIVQRHSRRI